MARNGVAPAEVPEVIRHAALGSAAGGSREPRKVRYMHIQPWGRRTAFLRQAQAHVEAGAPLLVDLRGEPTPARGGAAPAPDVVGQADKADVAMGSGTDGGHIGQADDVVDDDCSPADLLLRSPAVAKAARGRGSDTGSIRPRGPRGSRALPPV